ncbi:lysine-rich nucleolar protein 1 isoform X1 [Pteropus medius]|uniref:lysine-rich nucleolar protein 1 isoform X1 n=1 Tax=Pteropus vampyrus TaxID=132908 RepID=UPI00196AB717|nr:lysine-rich nucleolar protein 1 isoform X1 [Pteropus giganteus]XP_039741415.1 lysine-rich nucleolar protein 1 isoform X1 [Pteropus giganteus]XP_039741416.1 lysine-rich nucleolar protein 1 isoform X1 [Pteropus giganteus]XP_039741417.1 lysine-rich nucleolar protein 1 isoform X1 [Pteropus giganteus]
MITKTHKEDLGLGLPEKKKKKKVVAKEAETQSWVLNSDNYSTEVRPSRARSPSKSVVQGPAPKMPSVKKKKKKKKKKGHSTVCEEHLESEATVRARRTEASPSPRGQALGFSRLLSGEKKKKKSLRPLATSPGSTAKTSPDPTEGEEVTKVGKKPKKHKKEKKAQEAAAVSARDPWFCEAGPEAGSVGQDGQGQAALRQKRKQGSPREHTAKTKKKKKKKKSRQEGDTPLHHPEPSRSAEGSPRKGGEKRPVRAEASEYIPLEDGSGASAKKKTKSRKRAGQPGSQEPAPKRKRRRSRGEGAGSPWEEEPDTDLEVVLEKKGNMDEAHIDQVRRKALQEEIDRESGKTETSETRKSTGTRFGQWDTAGFENEQQKLKFLKLMGGFKNPSPSLSGPRDTMGRPNMALSRRAADSLQHSLQQDYERAVGWKCSRRAGLGFTAAPSKTFYIDRNASKSIRFED